MRQLRINDNHIINTNIKKLELHQKLLNKS